MPFHFREAAANLLTNPALDPFGKIPEFKVCAVRIEGGRERGARRARPAPRSRAGRTAGQWPPPPADARRGGGAGRRVPRPQPDPGAVRHPGAGRLAPREELVTLAREVHRPLYEIEGLITSFSLTEPPRPVALHACATCRAGCRGRTTRSWR